SLDELFEQLGLRDSYQDLSNLKKRVIKPSLQEISTNTDIDLSYENVKRGRSVVGFKFIVKEKPKPKAIGVGRDPDTVDMFFKMTDAQINMFGNQLAQLSELSHLAVGNESYDALASRIKDMLKDPDKQKQFIPHLRKLGFKTT
ncbi:replication initiation protein, partial [Acinetobacter baumannii]